MNMLPDDALAEQLLMTCDWCHRKCASCRKIETDAAIRLKDLHKENAALRPLVWSSELPTQEGWYWYRQYATWKPLIVQLCIDRRSGRLMQHGWSLMFQSNAGKSVWAGPIPEPVVD